MVFRPIGRGALLCDYHTMRFAVFAVAFMCCTALPAQARIYRGAPDLALTAAIVQAGGGPAHFEGARLLAALAGPALPGELTILERRHGVAAVRDFAPILTFAIRDTLRIATQQGVTLPPPRPAPGDRRALVRAVWEAGHAAGGSWDVGVFLERLMTHPIHHALMHDIDADPQIGAARNATFHEVLSEAMNDLARADHLETTR